MSLVISSGHGQKIRGASGIIDEVDEARRVVDRIAELFAGRDIDVSVFHDNTSDTQGENLETIVAYHNDQDRELDVSVHFNAYTNTSKPMGTEVLYVTQADAAAHVANAIASAGFINRGAKYRDDLYFLNNTEQPAILIEVCFVDSVADTDLYRARFDQICKLIAAAILTFLDHRTSTPGGEEVQTEIKASVFGGESDYNVSAYDEDKVLNDTDLYVALPDRFEGERPKVMVINRENDRFTTASIEDVGPWNIDDPYWVKGTRPQAETGTDMSGRKTNGAGIDLSPALAKAIGIDGMGMVDWHFIEE
jgi:hypothetical protein